MCHAMNPGWAFTFIAFIYVVLLGVVLWIMRDGMKWRQELAEKKRIKKEEKEKKAREMDMATATAAATET